MAFFFFKDHIHLKRISWHVLVILSLSLLKTHRLLAVLLTTTLRRAFIKDRTRKKRSAALRLQCSLDVYGYASFPVIFTRKTEIKSVSYRVR